MNRPRFIFDVINHSVRGLDELPQFDVKLGLLFDDSKTPRRIRKIVD